jgi:hypothetical protein
LGGSGPSQKEKYYISPVSQEQRNKKSFLINYRNIMASKGSAGEDGPSQVPYSHGFTVTNLNLKGFSFDLLEKKI